MKKTIALSCLAVMALTGLTVFGQEKREFATYREMRAYLGELFNQKKYAEAAALLESVLDRFPDNVMTNVYNLATMRLLQGDVDKAMAALEEGHRRGVFFGLWDFNADMWEPLRKHERFAAFLKENEGRVEEASRKAVLLVDVVTPEGYDPAKKYPLFIALHGGGESLVEFKPNWVSARLGKEFLVAYVQSTQVANMRGFHWQNEDTTRRDIAEAYRRILARYSVDPDRILIGGFSSGGFASLIVAFSDLLPVRGFVVLCPEPPQTIEDAAVVEAAGRGLRGTLLTTEWDQRLDRQKEFVARLARLGLDCEISVTPNIGHWYPENFAALLDGAIGRILGDGRK
jgi:predicted esterase